MKVRGAYSAMLMAVGLMAGAPAAHGAGDLTQQVPTTVTVRLGDEQNALRFFPGELTLETGKLYRLVLVNPSRMPHYFSSEGLAQAVFTRKVQINGPDGKPIAEAKGLIREIEVFPNGTAEWWFVPVKAGRFPDLRCTIAGHAEGGMTGGVTIR
jgi:uncharacterized cupredoxin-like copper-binding protein